MVNYGTILIDTTIYKHHEPNAGLGASCFAVLAISESCRFNPCSLGAGHLVFKWLVSLGT